MPSLRLTLTFPSLSANQRYMRDSLGPLLIYRRVWQSVGVARRGPTVGNQAEVSGLEESGQQGGDGGFDPQDALAQLHRLQAGLPAGRFRRESSRLPGRWPGSPVRSGARARRVIAGMADQAEGAFGDGRQAIFDERLEAFFDDDSGSTVSRACSRPRISCSRIASGSRNGVCQKLFSTGSC
jgi:hypothetical protein